MYIVANSPVSTLSSAHSSQALLGCSFNSREVYQYFNTIMLIASVLKTLAYCFLYSRTVRYGLSRLLYGLFHLLGYKFAGLQVRCSISSNVVVGNGLLRSEIIIIGVCCGRPEIIKEFVDSLFTGHFQIFATLALLGEVKLCVTRQNMWVTYPCMRFVM